MAFLREVLPQASRPGPHQESRFSGPFSFSVVIDKFSP